ARRDRKRRQHLMEASFADAANNHHFKRARWRRLWRQQIQDYLIAAIQNVRILLAHQTPEHSAAMAARAAVILTESLFRPLRRCIYWITINSATLRTSLAPIFSKINQSKKDVPTSVSYLLSNTPQTFDICAVADVIRESFRLRRPPFG